MKIIIYVLILFFSVLSFGQIGDPTPNLDIERSYQNTENTWDKWDFSKKPYKKIIKSKRTIDLFDSIGRHIERNVIWNDFTTSVITKYKDDKIVEATTKKIYNLDKSGNKIRPDEITTTKLHLNDKGKILDGKTFKLLKDSIFKVIGYQYYDNKNRLIKTTDSTGLSGQTFYYSGKNLTRIEAILQVSANTKIVTDKTYKYNKDDQIVFYKSVRSTFENNKLREKNVIQTVNLEYKDNLLIKKILIDNSETIERTYTYDKDKNLITFIEIKKNNSDGMITSQMKRTKKYENTLLVYSEVQEGLSKQQGKFSFTYYFHSDDESLVKQAITDNKGNLEVEYLYNEYGHLIKTITTFSDIPSSKSEIVYEIEYY
ncbi:MAG: hypothetical protein EAZ75_07925 [Flavobacteriia bacterium]|jgi:hypothetical protein|uniref:hypothetical protein n=1 Tax=Flavobacterium sp. TaxID=239 RepID=UPI0029781AFD|nr:MAG: hypothetical protein EAZ75_07925 [Flavobacteriia bacterium]